MTLRTLLLALVASLAFASAAQAAATARIADPAGDAAGADVRSVTIEWDDAAVTVSIVYERPQRARRVDLLVSPASKDETNVNVRECDPDREGIFTVAVRGGNARLRLGQRGAAFEGETLEEDTLARYRFRAEELARAFAGIDPFACASGTADDDGFYGAFEGRTLKLTPATARSGLTAELRRRFGAAFTGSRRRAVRCPRRAISPAAEPGGRAEAICAFRFDLRRQYRMGTTFVSLESGRFAFSAFRSRRFPLTLRHCGVNDGSGRWHAPPGIGAGIEVWGQRVTCRRARHVALRWRGRRRVGRFRCRVIARGEEFVAVRCTARGGRVVRFEAGA
ncbi:MAG TPA: hypothetical protein VHF89_09435 [Solirubrobacteraceae bacterium]|nr:hypothetical protein [Solirubrobacteraceae bacterium]